MTREQQDTERALTRAEHDWLLARGWTLCASGVVVVGYASAQHRYSHPAAPNARTDYTRRDALAMTRADPLRFMARRHVGGPA